MNNQRQKSYHELTNNDRSINFAVIWLVVTVCVMYLVSQFLRNSVGVITVELTNEFGISAYDLGLLSGVFFFIFAAVQIPLGVSIDRYGPRRCMLTLTLIALVGCIIFAYAENSTHLIIGRALMGLGCASFLMAPFVLFSSWFKQENFSFFASIITGVGTLGALLATAPLSFSVELVGWRGSFLLLGLIIFLGSIMIFFLIHDHPKAKAVKHKQEETLYEAFKGVGAVIKNPEVLKIFPIFLFSYSSFATILGLWGGPFLSEIYGAGLQERGNILLIIALANFIGLFSIGNIDRKFNSRKTPVMVGMIASCSSLIALSIFAGNDIWFIYIIFGVFGFSCGYLPVLSAHGRAIFSHDMAGRGITFLNIGSMGGTFILQYITGLIMSLFENGEQGYGIVAYKTCFMFIVAMMIIGIITYYFVKDVKPYKDHGNDELALVEL